MNGSPGSPFCSSTLGVPGISTRNPISLLRYSRQAGAASACAARESAESEVNVVAAPTRADMTRRRDQLTLPMTRCNDIRLLLLATRSTIDRAHAKHAGP